MSYIATGTADAPQTDTEKLDLILLKQAQEARRRNTTFILGAIGAIIAAARLGIVAVPMIHAARARPRKAE